MKACRDFDAARTRVVDGEAAEDERRRVAAHLRQCPPCERDLAAEDTARQLVRDQANGLVGHAPLGLRARCAATRAQARPPVRRPFPLLSLAGWPVALAATLVLAVAGVAFYGLAVNPSKAVAAQLALDHLKCFTLFEEPAGISPAEVEAALRASLGMAIAIPSEKATRGLTLVGGRRCLYLDGSVAHLLYRRGADKVSLFVLPTGAKLGQTEVDVFGHAAVAFTRGGRTWVALARLPHQDLKAMAVRFAGVTE